MANNRLLSWRDYNDNLYYDIDDIERAKILIRRFHNEFPDYGKHWKLRAFLRRLRTRALRGREEFCHLEEGEVIPHSPPFVVCV